MYTKNFLRYLENKDVSKIPANALTVPSKNVFIKKGSIETRKGFIAFGAQGVTDKTREIVSSGSWNTTLGAELPWRVDGNRWFSVYIKELDVYVNLLTLNNRQSISHTTWIDQNQDIIRDRFVFVDGSDSIYAWNGAIAKIRSIAGNNVTIEGTKTLAQLGFDKGDTQIQTVNINRQTKNYTQANINTTTLTLNNVGGISVGDYIIVNPVKWNNSQNLAGFNKDVIFSYKNHLVAGSFISPKLFFSDVVRYGLNNGFDFTIPLAIDRTLATPFFVILNNGIQGMSEKRGRLRVSTLNAWFSINKSLTYDSLGFNVSVQRTDIAHNLGCFPNAVAEYKGDIIFIARDKTIQSIIDVDTRQESAISRISDDITDLLQKSDLTGVKINYNTGGLYITVPREHMILIFDMEEGFWQPPQYFPVNSISFYKDKILGHHSGGNSSFELFKGDSDLGQDIEYNMTFGFQNYDDNINEFKYKTINHFGLNLRINNSHGFNIRYDFISGGRLFEKKTIVDWDDIHKANYEALFGLGSVPLGETGLAETNLDTVNEKKAIFIDTLNRLSFFEWRPVISLFGKGIYMRLISYTADIDMRDALKIDKKNYHKKQNFKINKKMI